ncbi:hypothetical protein Taro_023432, partial [Colocasia esculenta]|nr:hypothetical protein [Colocasia esculenta]
RRLLLGAPVTAAVAAAWDDGGGSLRHRWPLQKPPEAVVAGETNPSRGGWGSWWSQCWPQTGPAAVAVTLRAFAGHKRDMTAEKNLRGVLRSEVDRSVSKDKIIIVDSLNDIKVSKEQCRDSGLEEEEQHRNPFLNIVGDVRLSSSLLAPKPQFRYQVSVARWDEEMRLGEIIKMKGSIWTSMGVSKEQCRDSGLEEEEQHRNPFLNIVGDVRLSSSLLAPKPQFRYQVSVARWDEEMRLGEIIKMKGSIWTSMGVIRNAGKLYCTIEEILFLVERGALHLLDGKDVVLSLNDIYKKVSEGKSGCSWECFVVYRHLKSLGYIVRRHGLPWALKSEKNCCFDTPLCSNSLFALDDNEKSDRELESDVHITRLFEAMQVSALKLEFDVFLPDSKFKKASPGNPNFVLSLISEKPPRRREVEDLERQCNHVPLKFCNVDHGRVSFYSFDEINLPVLP